MSAELRERIFWLLSGYEASGYADFGGCPECFGWRRAHQPDCELQAVLEILWAEKLAEVGFVTSADKLI